MSSVLNLENIKMVAAGAGSDVLKGEHTDPILKEALDLSGAEKPKVLVVATAEPTEAWYNEFIQGTNERFKKLGANVTNLHEFGKAPSQDEIDEKIGTADTIWVAGGDTLHMMEFWKEHGIDVALGRAAQRGAVMSGGSAGMLAWMEQGHSDSLSYRVPEGEPWDYIFVKGLGYINVTAIPHFDSMKDGELRSEDFKKKFKANDALPNVGLGIDNMAALSIVDGQYRVISTPNEKYPRAQVHILHKTKEGIEESVLPAENEYKPLEMETA